MLLAIGLAALLCAPTARTGPVPAGDVSGMSTAGSSAIAGESHRSHDSEQQWRPLHHSLAAGTESVWKSAPVHAALAATRSARTSDPVCPAGSHAPPLRSAPHYLRHTPLLI